MPRPKKPAAEPKPAAAAKPAKPSRKAASEDEPEKESAYASEWERAAPENAKVMPILISDKYQTVEIPALEEFDPSTIKLDGTVVAIGKRRTGKSWAFRYIMHTLRKEFPAGIAISQTDEMNHFWRQYMPAKFIFDRYDPAIIEAVFARQKAILNDERYTEEEREKLKASQATLAKLEESIRRASQATLEGSIQVSKQATRERTRQEFPINHGVCLSSGNVIGHCRRSDRFGAIITPTKVVTPARFAACDARALQPPRAIGRRS
jgi:hypothetical protein